MTFDLTNQNALVQNNRFITNFIIFGSQRIKASVLLISAD